MTTWNCNVCALINNNKRILCQACFTQRSDIIPTKTSSISMSYCDQNVSKCMCSKRIKMIVNNFNSNNDIEKLFNEIPFENGYTNIHLLNDFHHIKYYHNV
eukprot:415154_1